MSTAEGDRLSTAVVDAIGHTAVPHIDTERLVALHGTVEGERVAADVLALVREANAIPIDWGDKTLVQGVNDVMSRFRALHPALSVDALHEIGRCVGWRWR